MFLRPCFQTLIVASLLGGGLFGCSESGFESHFVESKVSSELIDEARKGYDGHDGVSVVVEDHFGTPQDLRIWMKLPLNIGGTKGTIAEAPSGEGPVGSFVVKFETEVKGFEESSVPLQFLTGASAGTQAVVKTYSADSNVCRLVESIEGSLAVGDEVLLNGGEALRNGRKLYQRHCSHCHGTSGDGAGPTAVYMTPRPRDYRDGIFKFTRTPSLKEPARADIERTLRQGIPGTYMPSFVPMLKDEELAQVIEYVRFLSMRGEYERKLAAEMTGFSKEEFAERLEEEKRSEILAELKETYVDYFADVVTGAGDEVAERWAAADSVSSHVMPSVPRTPDSMESRRRGRELFVGATLNCINCHGISGQGNGPQTTEYEIVDKKPRALPGLHDQWGHLVKPRNLTTGIYRGGRRPIDIFRRLYSGINGAKMPAFGGKVKDEELWDVVNYVLSVPYDGVEPGAPAASQDESTAGL